MLPDAVKLLSHLGRAYFWSYWDRPVVRNNVPKFFGKTFGKYNSLKCRTLGPKSCALSLGPVQPCAAQLLAVAEFLHAGPPC